MQTGSNSATGLVVSSVIGALTVAVFYTTKEAVGLPIANAAIALAVFVQGLFVLRFAWNLELGGRLAIPFATTFLGIQHIAFGLGGLFVTFFNEGFDYENAQGLFDWAPATTRCLILHGLSMNVSLLGIWLASARLRGNSGHQGGSWRTGITWDFVGPLCMVTLAMHGPCWVLPGLITMPDPVQYVVQSFAPCTLGSYLLWGLSWTDCRSKNVFIAYNIAFVVLMMIEGSRGIFMYPILMFSIGYLISAPPGFFRLSPVLKWMPLILLVFWAFLKTDDLRTRFARGAPTDFADAMERLDFIFGSSADDSGADSGRGDGSGREMNGMFRIGSRLFELSAADVTARTPEEFPFWGWTDEDTSILLTGFVPLKLNPNATANTSGTAGVLFLQTYGWTQVDPTQGNSMPATVVADSWRRFGWLGVVLTYVILAWVFTKLSLLGEFTVGDDFKATFFTAFTCTAFQYTTDMTTLVSSTPRRVAVTAAFALLVQFLASFQSRRKRASARRVSWQAAGLVR